MIRCQILLLTAAIMAAGLGWSQDSPRVVSALSVDVRPGTVGLYEGFVKRLIDAHGKVGSEDRWTAYSMEFGPANRYLFVSTQPDWSGFDTEPANVLVEAYGAAEAERLAATLFEVVSRVSRGAWLERLDLSLVPAEDGPAPGLIGLVRASVKPYGNGPYEQYLRMVLQATREAAPAATFTVYSPSFGAQNTYLFVSELARYADLVQTLPVPERLIKAFGQNRADRLLAQRDELVSEQEVVMMRVRKELSRKLRGWSGL